MHSLKHVSPESSGASLPQHGEGGRWKVAVHAPDAAVARETRGDLLVVVMVQGGDAESRALRERLRTLLDAACDVAPEAPGAQPMPLALQRTVRSLVQWSEDAAEDAGAGAWWALAFLHSPATPMIVHLGGTEPRIATEGGVVLPRTQVLRGRRGGQARAVILRPGNVEAMSMSWDSAAEVSNAATVVAHWSVFPQEPDAEDLEAAEPELVVDSPEAPVARMLEIADPATGAAAEVAAPDANVPAVPATTVEADASSVTTSAVEAKALSPSPGAPHAESAATPAVEANAPAGFTPDASPHASLQPATSPVQETRATDAIAPAPQGAPELARRGRPSSGALVRPVADAAQTEPLAAPPHLSVAANRPSGATLPALPAGIPSVSSSGASPASTPLAAPASPATSPSPVASSSLATQETARPQSVAMAPSTPATTDAPRTTHDFVAKAAPPVAPDPARKSPPKISDLHPAPPDRTRSASSSRDVLEAILADADVIPGIELDTPLEIQRFPTTSSEPPAVDPVALVEPIATVMPAAGEAIAAVPAVPGPPASAAHREEPRPGAATPTDSSPRSLAPTRPNAHETTPTQEPRPRTGAALEEAPAPAESPAEAAARRSRPARPLPPLSSAIAVDPGAAVATSTTPAPGKRLRPRIESLYSFKSLGVAAAAPPSKKSRPAFRMSRSQALFAAGVLLLGLIVWFQARSLSQKPAQSTAAKAAAAEQVALQQATAHPMNTIVVRVSFDDNEEIHPVIGAQVWIDGKQRADAPLAMELEPGPHTIRVNNHGQDSPVRVVTIPGADRQVLDFQFKRTDDARSFVVLRSEPPSMLDRVVAITAYLEGLSDEDMKEMHVNLRDGAAWREFPMTIYRAPGGVAGSVVIPAQLLAGTHPAPYYVTATHTMTNVQYFTEMQNAGAAR